ncbi:MAG TPA: branched-chain amino acid ABC transporter permease [Paracoccaceae bacterium]|nr:branched-chain amino acid ABC transporter permease [Paracoccaceae bacterium]
MSEAAIPAPPRAGLSREGWTNLVLLALLGGAGVLFAAMDEPFFVNLASRVAILAMAGVGLNLALGYGGMVSFGHAAFFGLGGYVAGIAAFHAFDRSLFMGWPVAIGGTDAMPAIWPIAMGVSALAALAIGALSLRTSGVYFIMITLAFAQMIYYFAISWPAYGGEDGLSIYVRNSFPGVDVYDPLQFFALCFGALLVALGVTARLTAARFGAALAMARLNETRLATAGIRPFPVRLAAFVISAAITGWAGALFADLNGFVSPTMLSWPMSGELIVFCILGGVGRLCGPVAGAAAFVLLEHFVGGVTERWQLVLGLILLGAVLFARGGIVGALAGRARHD